MQRTGLFKMNNLHKREWTGYSKTKDQVSYPKHIQKRMGSLKNIYKREQGYSRTYSKGNEAI